MVSCVILPSKSRQLKRILSSGVDDGQHVLEILVPGYTFSQVCSQLAAVLTP